MKILTRISQAALLLVMGVSLASCGAGAPTPTAEPTVDLSVVKTSAVSTVIAELTANAPKATATSAPTATTAATATLPILATPIVLATATKTNIPYTGGGGVVATVNTYVDQGKLTSQNPRDGIVLSPGVDFDAVWTIKNIGRRDWNDQFYFMYVAGNPEGVSFDHGMLPATKMGDAVTVTVDMVAPHEPGTYTSQWALVNDTAVKFFKFYITIVVK
jgi:hypothetical protein